MPQTQPDAVAPLLLELARAVRAWQFLEPGHPTREQALARAAAVWRSGLGCIGRLDLEVTDRGFSLDGGDAVEGPALDELARSFRAHRVLGIEIHPDLRADELGRLVAGLARPPSGSAALAAGLRAGNVRHLALWSLPDPSPADGGQGAPEGGTRDSGGTVELVRLLAELEPCDEPIQYKETSEAVARRLEALLAQGNTVDAYRAALVYGRHVTDVEGRLPEIRAEARRRLRELFEHEALRAMMLERAYALEGSTSVQAIQLLICLTPESAARLRDEYGRGDAERRRQTARILVAMGSQALPAIAADLSSESPGHARRAVRLLGDMQNPEAVELLARRIGHEDSAVRREVARALARIRSPRAIQVLAEALRGPSEMALFAAAGLGTVKHPEAVRALLGAVQEQKGRPPELRREAIRNLGRLGDAAAIPVLREILAQAPWLGRKRARTLRVSAAEAIGKIGGAEALEALQEQTRRGDAQLRQACREILRELDPGAGGPLP
jgi:hypothetical protein